MDNYSDFDSDLEEEETLVVDVSYESSDISAGMCRVFFLTPDPLSACQQIFVYSESIHRFLTQILKK